MTDLRTRFADLARRLGAHRDAMPAAGELLAAYAEPARAYHGVAHLVDCLARLDEASAESGDHDRVEAAIWYHDAVYDARANDNEERSARFAHEALTDLGIASVAAEDVARLIRLTDHRTLPPDHAGRLLCDIDLSILGRSPEEFDAYDAAIRAEYARMPDDDYRAGRHHVLAALLARDHLFGTEQFRRRYELTARANLRKALARLEPKPT